MNEVYLGRITSYNVCYTKLLRGTGIQDNVYFNPAIAGIGNHVITYDFFGETCQFTVTVNDVPEVSCPGDITVSINDAAVILDGASPAGGTYTIDGSPVSTFDPQAYRNNFV